MDGWQQADARLPVLQCRPRRHDVVRVRRRAALAFISLALCLQELNLSELNCNILSPLSYRVHKVEPPQPHKLMFMTDVKIVLFFAGIGYAVCFSQQRFMGCPHVEDVAPDLPPPPEVGALLAAGLYGANVAYNVLNKRLLTVYPNPVLITTLNLGTCSLCCLLSWALGVVCPPKLSREKLRLLLPMSLLTWSGMLCANISVSEVNISFTHTVKAAEPLFTAVFVILLLGGSRPTTRSCFGLVLIIIGVILASSTEISFTWLGLWAAMASNVSVSLRTVLSKSFIGRKDVTHPLNVMAVLMCGSFLMSLPVALLVDRDALHVISPHNLPCLLCIGPLVWMFNVASILILSKTSPVTHSVMRTLRRPVLVVASIVAFGTSVPPLNASGILLTLFGMFLLRGQAPPQIRQKVPLISTAPAGFSRGVSGL